MNAALYYHGVHSPRDTITDADSIIMAARWVELDWLRLVAATAAFVAALRALTLPWPGTVTTNDPMLVRWLSSLALAGVAAFVLWFVAHV